MVGSWSEYEERCHQTYPQVTWALALGCRGARQERWEGAWALRANIPSELANTLWAPHPPQDLSRLLLQARRFYGHRPWRLVTLGAESARVARALEPLRPVQRPGEPGMFLPELPSGPAEASDLTVRRVEDPAGFRDFLGTTARGFSLPLFALRVIFPRQPPDAPNGTRFAFLVGYRGGRPVATSGVGVWKGVAALHFVSTLPELRQHGYGRALTRAALVAGRDLGAEVGFLQATEMGAPVYTKMGFQRVAEYPEWHPPLGRTGRLFALGSVLRMALRL